MGAGADIDEGSPTLTRRKQSPRSKVDSVYEEITSENVERTAQAPHGNLLSYLSSMSPAPTFANLSKIALDIAHEHVRKTHAPPEEYKHCDEGEDREAENEVSNKSPPTECTTTSESTSHVSSPQDKGHDSSKRTKSGNLKVNWAEGIVEAPDPLPQDLPKGGKISPFMRVKSASPEPLPAYVHASLSVLKGGKCSKFGQPVAGSGRPVKNPSLCDELGSDRLAGRSLKRLHDLWEEHAFHMDKKGKKFLEKMEDLHTQVLQEIASVRVFDLKLVLEIIQGFADACRFNFLDSMRTTRKLEDGFAFTVYKIAGDCFAQSLQEEMDIRDKWYRHKMKENEARNTDALQKARLRSNAELSATLESQKILYEKKQGAEITELRTQLECERDEALAEVQKLQQQLELVRIESESLKRHHRTLRDEVQSNERWQLKYEKEHSKCQSLRYEMDASRRHAEQQYEQFVQQHQQEMQQKDATISVSRDTIFRLQTQLREEKQLRAKQAAQASRLEQASIQSNGGPQSPDGSVPQGYISPALLANRGSVSRSGRKSFMLPTRQSMARQITQSQPKSPKPPPVQQQQGSGMTSIQLALGDDSQPVVHRSPSFTRRQSGLGVRSPAHRSTRASSPSEGALMAEERISTPTINECDSEKEEDSTERND